MRKIEVQASLLAADFLSIGTEIKRVEESGVDCLHVDVMDGQLVDDISFGVRNVELISSYSGIPVDAHLMIDTPQSFAGRMADAGAKIITIQYEPCKEIYRTISTIREKGAEPAICIAPETSISALSAIVDWVDRVLLVTVSLGLGGQVFITSMFNKIAALIDLRDRCKNKFKIGVDGGVTLENLSSIRSLDIDYIVAGTTIFQSSDIGMIVKQLKQSSF